MSAKLDELFPSVNYLTLLDRLLNDAVERGQKGVHPGDVGLILISAHYWRTKHGGATGDPSL
jgi:hypothetical protein